MVIAARVLVLAALPNLLPLLTASALHKSRSTFLVHTPRYTRVSRFSSMACPINLQARSHNAAATAGTSRPPPTCQASFSLGPEGMLPMPAVGLGTFQVKEEAGYEAVKAAINLGYTHIDTASVYRNEAAIGRAIRESGIPREQFFITTKLAPKDQGASKAYAALCQSLHDLGMEYVDLFLIHWPAAAGLKHNDPLNKVRRHESYVELQQGVLEGKIKSLGVSNFEIPHLEALLADPAITIPPSVNQVECHPFYPQRELHTYCRQHNIILQAYSSLGQGNTDLLAHPTIKAIAAKQKMTPAQVLLRWALQRGIPVLPKTISPKRMVENLVALRLQLDVEDMQALDGLDDKCHVKYAWDPSQVV